MKDKEFRWMEDGKGRATRASGPGGFTLVELMIVIALVAILVALAYPSFARYIEKARRAEAQTLLVNWANNQEIWRANNPTYADATDLAVPVYDWYVFSVSSVSANNFTLTATAKSGTSQVNDEQKGTSCTPMTLTQAGTKSPAICW
jgi:type IV pilus assembly protein PilE